MMSKTVIDTTLANAQNRTRKKWLSGGSVLAAATAFVASGSPDAAHARGGMTSPSSHSVAPNVLSGRAIAQRVAPRQAVGETIDIPRVPQRLPNNQAILPNSRTTMVAPTVQQQITPAPTTTPVVTVPQPQTGGAGAGAQSTQQTGFSFQPLGAAVTNDPGINVLASASYDDTRVDFIAGVAVDTVDVLASSAIIDWTTFTAGASGTEVTFLGAGSNLEFTSALSDYTVLNRIFTPGFDSAIRIDGNVTSTTNSGATPGGNIWFYSPGGLIIGAGAVFDVGSLLLTTSAPDPADVTAGSFSVDFLGTPDPNSAIVIENNASITANNNNSYVAMVAPRIEQNGSVQANGSIAYVAAEQATMTINNGLFDISVDVGSEDANGIVHGATGVTGGPAQDSQFDEQGIYFVAVPKNNAIGMLVGGTVGFDAATTASEVDGKIILSTGNRVRTSTQSIFVPNPVGGGGTFVAKGINVVEQTVDASDGAGNITIADATLTSSTEVFAEGDLNLSTVIASQTGRAVDLDLSAGNALTLDVSNGNALNVSGDLDVTAGNGTNQGGDITINVSGATAGGGGGGPVVIGPGVEGLVVDGDLNVTTRGRGLDDFFTFRNNGGIGIGQDASAGDVAINISGGGNLQVGGSLNVDASAQGGKGEQQNGSADAGNVSIDLATGNLQTSGLTIDTQAIRAQEGKDSDGGLGVLGSDSLGGDVAINLLGGTSNLGAVTISANSEATDGSDTSILQVNDATGSNFVLDVSGGSHAMESLTIDLSAESIDSTQIDPTIGDGEVVRGTAVISVTGTGTVLNLSGGISINTSTEGVSADISPTQAVTISVIDTGPSGGLIANDQLFIDTSITRGADGASNEAGDVTLIANNGLLSVESLDIFTSASPLQDLFAGIDGVGTGYTAGDVSLSSTNGGTFSVSTQAIITAEGTARDSNSAVGIGQGGNVTVLADDGSITIGGDLGIDASGFALGGGTAAGASGEGRGGIVRITVQGAGGNIALNDLTARTDGTFNFIGEGGAGAMSGLGTNGSGGLTEINLLGGTFSADIVSLSSDGEGAEGGAGFDGGDGIGGDVVINLDGAVADMTNLEISANGRGGDGAFGGIPTGGLPIVPAGNGGDASGGTATFNATSGLLTIANNLTIQAEGNENSSGTTFGGRGGSGDGVAGGEGGIATGGTAAFNLNGTASVEIIGDASISTQAFGGDGGSVFNGLPPTTLGGDGGDAQGGTATFSDVAGNLSFADLTVNSTGTGGNGGESSDSGLGTGPGGAGGDGIGGAARVDLNQDDAANKSYALIAQGIGGNGAEGITGGTGGLGQGGNAELAVNNVAVSFGGLSIDTTSAGGSGGASASDTPNVGGTGGSAIGGTSTLRVQGANGDFVANGLVELSSGSIGGLGGSGSSSFSSTDDGGAGGLGGNADGGTAQIIVSDLAVVTIDADVTVLNANSTGGQGGAGGSSFLGAGAGDGGDGGAATGGTVGIVAEAGAQVDIFSVSVPFALSSSGQGGNGGTGGSIDMLSGGTAGGGGNGGAGTGGAPTLSATGASITIGDTELFASGLGGNGGIGGDDGLIVLGADGDGGTGTGGAPTIAVFEGSPGIITLGDVTISASGTGGTGTNIGIGDGGQVTIQDMSPDPAGLITLGDLTVDATGDPTSTTGNLTFESGSGPITINGNLDAEVAGDIDFDLDGTGQVVVTGFTLLDATNDITFVHSGNAAENLSIDTGTRFTATAGGDFIAGSGSIIDAVQDVAITAQNIDYDDIFSTRTVNLNATNGSITGTATGTITGRNINTAISLVATQDVTFGNLITLDSDPLNRDGNITVNAGANITGTSAVTDQFITMDAVGLIDIDNVQSVGGLSLVQINGGSIDIETLDADGGTNLTTATGDLAVNDLDVRDPVSLISAAAIDVGTASTTSFTATAATDLTVGTLNTSGITRLTSGGTATYTQINSVSQVNIDAVVIEGGDIATTGLGVIDLEAERINIDDIDLAGTGAISLISNSDGIAAGNLNVGSGSILVDSASDVVVGDATSSNTTRIISLGDMTVGDIDAGGSTVLNSGGNLTAGALVSRTTSPGLSVTVNGDADIESASANGLFTINVTGALTGGTFTGAGALTAVNVSAASVDLTNVESVSQSVTVTATNGDATVGTATSNFNTTITGQNVTLNNGDVGRTLTLNATAGSINGTGTVDIGGAVNFDATSDINFGSLIAVGAIDIDAGGNITSTGADISGTVVNLDAGGDITANAIEATLSNAANNVVLNAGGALDVGSITAANNILLTSTTVDIGTLDAGASFSTVTATGAVAIDNAISSGNTTITGTSVALVDSDVGGNLSATATNGNVTVTGALMAGAVISLDASQNVNIASGASLDSGGTINIDTPGNVTFTGADLTSAIINMNVGGNVTGDNLLTRLTNANNTVDLTVGGTIDLQSITAANNILLDANTITVGTLDAIVVDVVAAGAANIGNAISGSSTDINAATITLGGADVTGALTATASAGNLNVNGDVSAGLGINLDASQDVNFTSGTTVTAGGAIGIDTPGNVNFAGADLVATVINMDVDGDVIGGTLAALLSSAANNVDLTVGGTLDVDSIAAANNIILDANSIDVGTLNAIFITASTPGALSVGNAISGNNTVLSGASVNLDAGTIGNNLTATSTTGDITGSGTITVAGSAFLDSARDIAIGTLDANSMTLFAARNVLFDALISPNDIEIDATGGQIGATATGAGDITSTAGAVDLTALTIAVGDVTAAGDIDAVAGGGDASFGDLDSGANINIQALGTPSVASVTSVGDTVIFGDSVSLSGGNVGGNLGLVAITGDVSLALDGTDQIVVGGISNINSAGGVNVTHTNNAAGTVSLDSTGAITIIAQGDVNAQTGSIISSDSTVTVRTEGDLSINDVRGVGQIDLSAAGNAMLNNAALTGGTTAVGAGSIVTGGIILTAGGDNDPAFIGEQFDPSAMASITGLVTSTGEILVEAGGNAIFETGSSTISSNGLIVNTGDDIIIEAGALVEAGANAVLAPNVANPFAGDLNLVLNAGALLENGQLFTTPLTPISSIVIEGTIEANDFAAVLNANAIDGLGGTINASSLEADVSNAPNDGIPQSDDFGLLSANCLEGNICLGTINANNQILIGQNSDNDTIALIIEQGTVNANRIAITTRNDIVMGTDGIATVLNAVDSFSVQSDAGDINLVDASISSSRVEVDAAGSLLGNATLTSTNDIGISVGDSLQAAAIITDGELTGAEDIGAPLEGQYAVAGDFDVGLLSQGASDIDVSAGGNINIGEAVSPDNVTLTADGDAFLGTADVTGDIDIFAQNIGSGNLTAGGSIILETNVGEIVSTGDWLAGADIDVLAATDVDVGALSAGGAIGIDAGGNAAFVGLDGGLVTVDAVGAVNGQDVLSASDATISGSLVSVGDIIATGTASVTGDSIAVREVIADQIDLSSANNILFDLLQSANTITVAAPGGMISATTANGEIVSDGGVSLTAQIIDVGNIDAGGAVSASATAGALSVGDVTATGLGSGVSLNSAGADAAINTGALTVNNADILLNTSGDITLDDVATGAGTPTGGTIAILSGGDVTVTGALIAGEDVAVRSLGDATLGTITAADDITVEADGAVTVGAANNTGIGVDLFRIVFNEAAIGQAGSIAFGGETLTGSSINLDAGTDVTVTGTLDAVDTVTLIGATIDVSEVLAGSNVTATSTTGTLTLDNTISGGTITLSGQGDILIDHAEADGDLLATGQAGLTTGLNSIITNGDIIILTAGISDLGNSSAGGLIDVTAGQIDFVTLVAGGTVTLLTQDFAAVGGNGNGNITGTDITAGPGASSLTANNGNINIGGTALIGGSLDADASGDLFINLLTTEGGGYTGTAGGQIGFNGITSADFVDLDATTILGNGPIDAVGDVLALGSLSVIINGNITSGGLVDLFSPDGPVDVDEIDAADDVTINGIGITTGNVTSATGNVDANANAGNAIMGAVDAAGSIDVLAAGTATITSLTSGTNSTVTAGTVNVTGGGNVGGNLILNATVNDLDASGTFAVGGAIDLDAVGDISFGTLDAQGGAFTADAGGAIDFTAASASGIVDLNAQTTITGGDISSDTEIDMDAIAGPIAVNDLTADGQIDVTTGGTFSANDIMQTDGNLEIDAGGGVTFANASGASGAAITTGAAGGVTAGSLSANNQVIIDTGTGGVDIGTLTTGTAGITAVGGAIDIDDAILTGLLTASGTDVDIQSSTDLMVDATATAGGVQVIAQGDLDAIASATGDVALVSLGNDAIINGASGQNVTLSAGGALDVVGAVNAAASLDMSANGLFTLDAIAIGQTINVDAGDVDITVDGILGDATVTQSITFTGFEEMLIGGAGGSGAPYEVDNDEFSRIHSGGDITFQVFSQVTGGPALITVDTLDVIAGDGSTATGQNIGQNAGLVLRSDEDISIIGDATITNATLDTLFIAEAIDLVRVNTATGGIFVLDGNAGLAGVIEITATDFNAVTDAAFVDIQGMSVADIDARLANSDGVDRPDGVLRADTLDIDTTASQVFIQNTVAGTDFADRRGFDVNTLLISDSGGTIQPIVINGVIGGITGIDTIPLAGVASTFDAASTINGCLIGNPASCAPINIDPNGNVVPDFNNDDTRDLIEEALDPEGSPISGSIQAGLLEYIPTAEFGQEPLIDEPVTGAGNEDLWVDPDCPPGADPEICGAEPAE